MRKFEPAQVSREKIENPYRCLGLAVIQQAFVDKEEEWLRGGEWLLFWCDVAELPPDALSRAVDYWFS